MKRGFYILWPELRTVSARQIHVWYEDAEANGDVELGNDSKIMVEKNCGKAVARALALHRVGVITLQESSR